MSSLQDCETSGVVIHTSIHDIDFCVGGILSIAQLHLQNSPSLALTELRELVHHTRQQSFFQVFESVQNHYPDVQRDERLSILCKLFICLPKGYVSYR